MIRSLTAAALFCGLLIQPAEGQTAPPTRPGGVAAEAAAMIEQLGDVSFQRREQADRRLIEIGWANRPLLAAAATSSSDVEIRARAARILATLERDAFQQRIERFLADIDGKQQHDLPGWERFRRRAGEGLRARKFFIAMLKADTELLRDLDAGRDPMAALQPRLDLLIGQRRLGVASPPERLGLILLAAVDVQPSKSPTIFSSMYQLLATQDAAALSQKPELRLLVNVWLQSVLDAKSVEKSLVIQILLRHGDPELGRKYGVKLVADSSQSVNTRTMAAVCVARFGDKSDVPRLLPLLKEQRLVSSWSRGNNVLVRTQARDHVLAMLLAMTDQEPADYGFPYPQPSPIHVYQTYSCGFEDDTQRENAHKKWQQWQAANLAPR